MLIVYYMLYTDEKTQICIEHSEQLNFLWVQYYSLVYIKWRGRDKCRNKVQVQMSTGFIMLL